MHERLKLPCEQREGERGRERVENRARVFNFADPLRPFYFVFISSSTYHRFCLRVGKTCDLFSVLISSSVFVIFDEKSTRMRMFLSVCILCTSFD